jgi:tetrahydromethanopterin S-methyltransferase subunit C
MLLVGPRVPLSPPPHVHMCCVCVMAQDALSCVMVWGACVCVHVCVYGGEGGGPLVLQLSLVCGCVSGMLGMCKLSPCCASSDVCL